MRSSLYTLLSRSLRTVPVKRAVQPSCLKAENVVGRLLFGPLQARAPWYGYDPIIHKTARATFATKTDSNSTLPRTNISFLGATNAGKSVLMNLLTQSDVSIVHDTHGTTADIKLCLLELHGKMGPIRLMDTPGINEKGELGVLKKDKAMRSIGQSDIVVFVVDPFDSQSSEIVADLILQVHQRQKMNEQAAEAPSQIPSPVPLLLYNIRQEKVNELEAQDGSVSLLIENLEKDIQARLSKAGNKKPVSMPPVLAVDLAASSSGISRDRVINFLERYATARPASVSLLPDSLATDTHNEEGHQASPIVFLNIPMDQQTPSMRLLRPQAMVQEALLRNFCSTYSYRMDLGLARSNDPTLVQREKDRFFRAMDPLLASGDMTLLITDSQAIDIVAPWTIDESTGEELVPITTFSITMIRYLSGGRLGYFVDGLEKLDQMVAGDVTPVNGQKWKVLISEACNHTRLNLEKECADIGTVQIPNHLSATLGDVNFEYAFGKHAIFDPTQYDLVVHCGGCMLTPQQMDARVADLADARVSATNYGLLLSKIQSPETLARVLRPWGIQYELPEDPGQMVFDDRAA